MAKKKINWNRWLMNALIRQNRKADTKAFTIIFEGDIRKFKGNPLKTETPFGVPFTVMDGDALAELDKIADR